jgi:D-arabinitol 2-dehydrogenase
MLSRSLLRASARAVRSATLRSPAPASSLHTTRILREKKQPATPGSFARTDDSITVEYPEDHELPSSVPIQGRGGQHMKRTLASFSLEGKVGVVTGGARGLGLVMGQGMVISGANLAIVDMNSKFSRYTLL